jgi:hypothetical protein
MSGWISHSMANVADNVFNFLVFPGGKNILLFGYL